METCLVGCTHPGNDVRPGAASRGRAGFLLHLVLLLLLCSVPDVSPSFLRVVDDMCSFCLGCCCEHALRDPRCIRRACC